MYHKIGNMNTTETHIAFKPKISEDLRNARETFVSALHTQIDVLMETRKIKRHEYCRKIEARKMIKLINSPEGWKKFCKHEQQELENSTIGFIGGVRIEPERIDEKTGEVIKKDNSKFARIFKGVVVGRDFDAFDGLTSYGIPSGILTREKSSPKI
jgi:hypothetical protein